MAVWSYPTRIVFGAGEARRAGEEARALGVARALLVTDAGVERAGLVTPVRESLERAGLAVATFAGVSPNPTEADVSAGAEALRAHAADGIVCLGGGSPIDAGKLIAVRAATSASWEELDDARDGGHLVPKQLVPVIALPTTAGTGSEVGRAGVLTVASTGRKTVVFAPQLLPRVAILDPELTVGLPASVTAATGFDALTHCVEAYLAPGDHPMADAIALAGVDLVAKFLGRAVADARNLEARGAMLKAAMMGAVAFQKGLGACHSLAHPLSSELGLHHGLANALCLPAVLDFNEPVALERILHLSLLLGGDAERGACAHTVRALRGSLGLPSGLAAVGVEPAQLDRLATLAHEDACHRSNPRECSRDDLLELYRRSR
ncbi:MAG: iron-containing alcohol dehydrogenase [Polyangiaceae bacterium]|nr:iron-containing alcohol dehydrogenase [Polyangiaceae bacterium]